MGSTARSPRVRARVTPHRGQGESLVPLYTRESVSLSLPLCYPFVPPLYLLCTPAAIPEHPPRPLHPFLLLLERPGICPSARTQTTCLHRPSVSLMFSFIPLYHSLSLFASPRLSLPLCVYLYLSQSHSH